MAETCQSCGRDDEPLVTVRRVYVTPERWDTPERVEIAGEERWCFPCRTHYPHQVIGAGAGEAGEATPQGPAPQ